MTDTNTAEREAAERWLRDRYGAYRGHFAWRELEEAFLAGRASLAASAGSEPVAAITALWEAIGYQGAHTASTGNLAPTQKLIDAMNAVEALIHNPSPPEGMAGWEPIETAPKYAEHGVRQHLLLGYAPDEIHEDGFVSQGYWMEAEEDAPDNMGHDGGWVDVHFDFFSCARSFGADAYRSAGTQPTHWKPLPAPPLPASAKEL